MKKVFFLTALLCILTTVSQAQITIGMDHDPELAALLDLKTQQIDGTLTSVSDDNNITSTVGGLLLPRVKLTSATSLQPFITDADNQTKLRHAGLTVYNINDSGFEVGIYVWNGLSWEKPATSVPATTAISGETIWLPSFNLAWGAVGTSKTVNLYDIYKAAYCPASYGTSYFSSTGAVVTVADHDSDVATDFDYVVTYYNSTIITINSIDPATGIMTYTPQVAVTPADSFINIMLVRK
ncbi:hypothetical protein FACS189413_00430 [Bacteroidia bacterium]|nr:hypothetical protein FACS189463_0070 [Bacteroidia bacterium]GHU66799.1 hypothetical protein FACS189413_00430 [Bacteroidia bacterium]